MKVLMIYCDRFAYAATTPSLQGEPPCARRDDLCDALVGFVHAEAADGDSAGKVETKLVKNLKWGARKNGTRRIVLHSFSHLAETKAPPEFTRELLAGAEKRLVEAGYETSQTPFGYFLDLSIEAPGRSPARIFVSF